MCAALTTRGGGDDDDLERYLGRPAKAGAKP